MQLSLSSITTSSLNTVLSSVDFSFVNQNRGITDFNALTASNTLPISYITFSDSIIDIERGKNFELFLTDFAYLSTFFSTQTAIDSEPYGFDMSQFNTQYDYYLNNFTQTNTAANNTQFLGIVSNDELNILPLKDKLSFDGEVVEYNVPTREYQRIYTVGDNTFLQFKTDKKFVTLNPDVYSYIFNSYNIVSAGINDAGFIENGAIGGNCPLNSDLIFFELNEYGSATNNGPDNINKFNNGSLLCLWLSSQTPEPSSSKIWMERWYDPNTVSQGDALITSYNIVSSSFQYVVDIPSDKIFSPKEKAVYLRYGPNRNTTYLGTVASFLVADFNSWSKNFTSNVNNISGFVLGDYVGNTDELILNGSVHGHIPPDDSMFVENELSVGLWSYSNDWGTNNESQLFGNFANSVGYGIFYNTGTTNDLISIATQENNIFALNNRGFKVFEKNIKTDLGLSAIDIRYVKTDLYGNRWLYDAHNQNIYKLESDDLIVKTIELPNNSNIVKMECNSQNHLIVLDTVNDSLSSFSTEGLYMSSGTVPYYIDNFEVDCFDFVVTGSAEFLTVNNRNEVVKVIGSTLYVDEQIVMHLTDKPQSVKIDLDDNIWILLKNRLIKIDDNNKLVFNKSINLPFVDEDAEMGFVKVNKGALESIQLWIVFNTAKQILIFNSSGIQVKQLILPNMFSGSSCDTFDISVHGDFTGFDNKRKFDRIGTQPINIQNPSFTCRISLKSEDDARIVSLHTSAENYKDWVHLAFTVENSIDFTVIKFYINGVVKAESVLSGIYSINYGAKSTPFIIGGISGKLGAKNIEKSIVKEGFFYGKVDNVQIYRKALNAFEVFNTSLQSHFDDWRSINYYVTIPPLTLIEDISRFHINRYRGFKSNRYNIVIRNFSDDETLQGLMVDYIRNNIKTITPVNTILNDIKFE